MCCVCWWIPISAIKGLLFQPAVIIKIQHNLCGIAKLSLLCISTVFMLMSMSSMSNPLLPLVATYNQSLSQARRFSSFFSRRFSRNALTSDLLNFLFARSARRLLPSWLLSVAPTS